MNKTQIIFLSAVLFLALSQEGNAEVVYFKNGTVVSGRIVNRNNYSVTMMVNNSPKQYYLSEIENIYEDDAAPFQSKIKVDYAQYPDIKKEKVDLIVRFVHVNGTVDAMQGQLNKILEQAQSPQKEIFEEILNVDEIMAKLIPVYDMYFSEEDLKGMNEFYQSPVGQKLLKVTPEITQEAMKVTIQYFQEKTK